MSNQYNWVVNAVDCHSSANGQSNVVFNVHWGVNGNDGVANTSNTAYIYGTQAIQYNANTSFTPVANLAPSTVISWVQAAMGANQVAAIQSSLDTQIAAKQTPAVITLTLPTGTANTH